MSLSSRDLVQRYQQAHDAMRSMDGLQPPEAFDELLKFLFFKQAHDPDVPTRWGPLPDARHDAVSVIRSRFKACVEDADSWVGSLWPDGEMHLSDACLAQIADLLADVDFHNIDMDVRSAALRTFLTPEVRRGLGIFLTPDDVVRMMVEATAPQATWTVLDPACGSGTFLIETIRFWRERGMAPMQVWGSDKSPRMVMLAALNLGHFDDVDFQRQAVDFFNIPDGQSWSQPDSVDLILTNPPFGMVLDGRSFPLSEFMTCRRADGAVMERQQGEVVFIEQALRLLRPGGTLAIVVPRSVVTNKRLAAARRAINQLGYVTAVVSLPSHTFRRAGTQARTVVLLIRKFLEGEDAAASIKVLSVNVTNVGFDATGRCVDGNQLPHVGQILRTQTDLPDFAEWLPPVAKGESFARLGQHLFSGQASTSQLRLGDIAELVCTGKSPTRAGYADAGLFLVKVGNLTGHGIQWLPRARNFIGGAAQSKRLQRRDLMLRPGDILLTSTAHAAKYIAKKVDAVGHIPTAVGGAASFVGELILIRPPPDGINPFVLLAYLRSTEAVARIQRMVRGQTAHLHPQDLLNLALPEHLLTPDDALLDVAALLQRESDMAAQMSAMAFEQATKIARLFGHE